MKILSNECPQSSLLETSCKLPYIYPVEPDIKGWLSHYGYANISFRIFPTFNVMFSPISCTKTMPNLAYLSEDNTLTIQKDLDQHWDLLKLPFR